MNSLYPNRALPLTEQPPVVLLAMCLFGEGRGEPTETRRAIAQVVVNRARNAHRVFGSQPGLSFHENIARVITRPRQFSCMMSSDVNYAKIFDPLAHEGSEVWRDCLDIASEALQSYGLTDSLTDNSDHYFDDSIQAPPWADPAKETVQLGRLRFFRLYLPALLAGSGAASPSGSSHAASAQPSPSTSSVVAAAAATEALPPSFPAAPPPVFRTAPHGSTPRHGGRELSSLEATREQAEPQSRREASA